jgi:hypothetical protein
MSDMILVTGGRLEGSDVTATARQVDGGTDASAAWREVAFSPGRSSRRTHHAAHRVDVLKER